MEPENFECDFDGKIFKSKRQLCEHMLTHFPKTKCNFCNEEYSFKVMRKHIRRVHLKNPYYRCRICLKNFKTNFLRNEHTKQHNHFECDFDGKIFKNKYSLVGHMTNHRPKIKCELCSVLIFDKSFKNHLKEVHTEDRKYRCDICTKAFKTKALLGYHRTIHDKKFQCEICNRKFNVMRFLKQHMDQYHINPKSFSCEICERKFNTKYILNFHKKIHNKNLPKPFKCQRCNFATRNKNSFKYHKGYHERLDEKFKSIKDPIKCELCPTLCRNARALNYHNKAIHSKLEFQCDLCGVYKKLKQLLKSHILLFHLKKNQHDKNKQRLS